MRLCEWMAIEGNTAAHLSRLTGIMPPGISRIVNKHVCPGIISAIKMDKGTRGELKAEELCPEHAKLIAYLRETK